MKLTTVRFTKPWGNYAVGNEAGFSADEAEPLVNGYTYERDGRKYKVAPVAKKLGVIDTAKVAQEEAKQSRIQQIEQLEKERDEIQARIDELQALDKPQKDSRPSNPAPQKTDAGDKKDPENTK